MQKNLLSFGDKQVITRWWQLKYFLYVHPKIWGEDEPNLTSIFFQMGWFNHQLENDMLNVVFVLMYVYYLGCKLSFWGSFFLATKKILCFIPTLRLFGRWNWKPMDHWRPKASVWSPKKSLVEGFRNLEIPAWMCTDDFFCAYHVHRIHGTGILPTFTIRSDK